jgi:hypothetical protein
MDISGSRGRNAFLTALGVLVALALVAISSRGSRPVGGGDARAPAQTLLDIFFALYLLAIVAAVVLLLYLLLLRRRLEEETGPVKRRRPLETLLAFVVLAGAASLLARKLAGRSPIAPPDAPDQVGRGQILPVTTGRDVVTHQPDFAWLPVTVTLALIFLALGAWWLSGRARRRARGETPDGRLAGALVVALDESLDDLRAEPDPRRAVIAAYARLERVLAAHELPRRASEAPLEYLSRVLEQLSVAASAVERLTVLFERAKFSQHAVAPEMKHEAIAALEDVRDRLLAARVLAERAREEALRAQRERAAT